MEAPAGPGPSHCEPSFLYALVFCHEYSGGSSRRRSKDESDGVVSKEEMD